MDPEAAYNQLVEALEENDVIEAREHARDLLQWIAKGGFVPVFAALPARTIITNIAKALYPNG